MQQLKQLENKRDGCYNPSEEDNNMAEVLLKDAKYEGRFVAIRDFDDKVVIADGKNVDEVYLKAAKRGVRNPVVFYVPMKGMTHIY